MTGRKNPFDIDMPPVIIPGFVFGNWPENEQEKPRESNKSRLTQTQKMKIKNIVGKCEYPGCDHPPHEVHHIKWLEEGGTDSYSNLIVLCGSHRNDAHGKNPQGKMIPKTKLKSIVKGRSKTRADNIKTVLKSVGKRGEGKRPENSRYPWEIDFRF